MTENKTPDAGPESLHAVPDDGGPDGFQARVVPGDDTQGHSHAIPDPDAGPESGHAVPDDTEDTEGHRA